MSEQTKDNFDVFFRRKPALMLVALKKLTKARYGSILAKEVDCTYSHAVKILQTLERIGLVLFEKKGTEFIEIFCQFQGVVYIQVLYKTPSRVRFILIVEVQ